MSYFEADIIHEIKHGACLLIVIVQKHGMLVPDLREGLMLPLTNGFVKLIHDIVQDLLGLFAEGPYVIKEPLTQCHAVLQVFVG